MSVINESNLVSMFICKWIPFSEAPVTRPVISNIQFNYNITFIGIKRLNGIHIMRQIFLKGTALGDSCGSGKIQGRSSLFLYLPTGP